MAAFLNIPIALFRDPLYICAFARNHVRCDQLGPLVLRNQNRYIIPPCCVSHEAIIIANCRHCFLLLLPRSFMVVVSTSTSHTNRTPTTIGKMLCTVMFITFSKSRGPYLSSLHLQFPRLLTLIWVPLICLQRQQIMNISARLPV